MPLNRTDLRKISEILDEKLDTQLTEKLEPIATELKTIRESTSVAEHLYSLVEHRSFELAQRTGHDPDAIDAAYSGWTKEQLERLAAFFERKLKEFT